MKWLKYGALGLLGIVALSLVTLLVMGRREGAGKTVSTIEINRPPADVWTWVDDKDKYKQWVSWTVDVKDDGPKGAGGKRRVSMRDPNMDNQIVYFDAVTTEYNAPTRLKVHITSPLGFEGDATYDLVDLGGRTRFTAAGAFKYSDWFAALLEPVITPQAKAKEDADLATLKRLAESAQ